MKAYVHEHVRSVAVGSVAVVAMADLAAGLVAVVATV